MNRTIRVSAVLISDDDGRALMVRKHGTTAFMQPGGKPEPGENAAQTAARELGEELGLSIGLTDLTPLGTFHTSAANEAGFALVADCFSLRLTNTAVAVAAEIAEARWLTLDTIAAVELAPLSKQAFLPLLWGEAPVQKALAS